MFSKELLPTIHILVSMMFEESHLMEIGVFTCMTLISREENRTMRFGILTAIFNLVPKILMGSSLGPYFYDRFGYDGLILTSLCFFILGLLVLIFVLELESDSKEPFCSVVSSPERY